VADELLDLLDYRRRVRDLYGEVRALRERDARAAHSLRPYFWGDTRLS